MNHGAGQVRDERGLVGKAIVVSLVILALIGIAAVDAGSILLARFKAADTAQQASYDAAVAYRDTHSKDQALRAALADVRAMDPGARLGDFSVNTVSGEVTVTVTKKASTLVVKRIGFLRHFQRVQATDTSLPQAG